MEGDGNADHALTAVCVDACLLARRHTRVSICVCVCVCVCGVG